MPSHQQHPVAVSWLGRVKRLAVPAPLRRRWLRLRWLAGPMPADWWPQFERDFRAYCGSGAGRPGRTEPDR